MLNLLTLKSLEEVRALSHKVVEWVVALELLAMTASTTLAMATLVCLLLIRIIHSRCNQIL